MTLQALCGGHPDGPGGVGQGILPPPNVELLDGVVVLRELPLREVVETVLTLAAELDRRAPSLQVDVRAPVVAPPHDLLRPEVILRRPVPAHLRRVPVAPESLLLAVLVARDEEELTARARRCAILGVAELWGIVPTDGLGVRYGAPRGGRYSEREALLPGEPCSPAAVPWLEVVPVPARRPRSPAGRGSAARTTSTTSREGVVRAGPQAPFRAPRARPRRSPRRSR